MTESRSFGKYSFSIFDSLIETEGLDYSDVFYNPNYLGSEVEYRSLVLFRGRNVDAVLYYHIHDGAACSIKWGTYGGVFGRTKASIETVSKWIDWWCQELRLQGVSRVELKMPPIAYDEKLVSFNLACMMNAGFRLITDVSFIWTLGEMTLFKDSIDSSNRNKLNKAKRVGMVVAIGGELSFLMECYNVIKLNREENEIPLSLSSLQAEKLFEKNKRHWFGIKCMLGEEIIAAGLFLQVKSDTVYVFMWGERKQWRSYSPTLMIGESLFDKCKNDNLRIVDLGTATEGGRINRGLWDYKKHLGCSESVKFTMVKEL